MALSVGRKKFTLPREVEPDVEIFAFGDIHGRVDLLQTLLDEGRRSH
jgi:hypothetical protein